MAFNQKRRVERKERKLNSGKMGMYTSTRACASVLYIYGKYEISFVSFVAGVRNVFIFFLWASIYIYIFIPLTQEGVWKPPY